MVTRLVLAAALLAAALAVAWRLERRRPEAPSGRRAHVPAQLDRADFPRPDAPWLVVLFSSSTCESCATMAEKVATLESPQVAVFEAEYAARRDLHDRYAIDAVPLVLVSDAAGVVRRSLLGNTPAPDLWAAVADARATPGG